MSTAPHPPMTPTQEHPHSGLRWAAVTVACCLLFLAAMEMLARVAAPRMSRIERRTVLEYQQALKPPSGKPYVLVVGNSLLDAALDADRAKRTLAGKFDIRRLVIEQTVFYDWYFGMRRLFREGARPNAVVLMLSPTQLNMSGVRGEYFAFRLMNTGDILSVAHALHLSPTATANIAAGSISGFYGLRSEIRKVLLGHLLPDVPVLMQQLALSKPRSPSPDVLRNVAAERLRMLRQVVEENGATLLFVVPPQIERDGLSQALLDGGRASGVTILFPLAPGALDASYFSDGFHMNQRGARVFTPEFTGALEAALTTSLHASNANRSVAPGRGETK